MNTNIEIDCGCVTLKMEMRIEPPDMEVIGRFVDLANNIYGDEIKEKQP